MNLKVISTVTVYKNIPSDGKRNYTLRFIIFYVITETQPITHELLQNCARDSIPSDEITLRRKEELQ